MVHFKFGKYGRLDSTNDYLRALSRQQALEEGTGIIAMEQSNGRGHGTNRWESEKGKNLLFSFYLKPDFLAASRQFQLSMVVSLSLFNTIAPLLPDVELKIKWPNDLLAAKKKIAGILMENSLSGEFLYDSLVGIGLNVNQQQFTCPGASSLALLSGKSYALDKILTSWQLAFNKLYTPLKEGHSQEIKKQYMQRLYSLNQEHFFIIDGERKAGVIIDIDEFGRLVIKEGGQVRHFGFKEIEYEF